MPSEPKQKLYVLEEAAAESADKSNKEVDLVEFFYFALRKIKVIVAAILAGLLLSGAYTFLLVTPIYEASAQLYVVNSKDSVVNLSDLQIGSYLTSDYQLVFKTWEVNEQVIRNLNLPYSYAELRKMLTVTNPTNTRALFITIKSPDPKEAATIANEFANVAREYISETMLADKPSILSTALEPVKPISPNKPQNLLLGAFAAGLLAILALFLHYMRDDKIKTAEDILKYTGSSPLAIVPILNAKNTRAKYQSRRLAREGRIAR